MIRNGEFCLSSRPDDLCFFFCLKWTSCSFLYFSLFPLIKLSIILFFSSFYFLPLLFLWGEGRDRAVWWSLSWPSVWDHLTQACCLHVYLKFVQLLTHNCFLISQLCNLQCLFWTCYMIAKHHHYHLLE